MGVFGREGGRAEHGSGPGGDPVDVGAFGGRQRGAHAVPQGLCGAQQPGRPGGVAGQ